jgi:hypothetical protein
MIPVSEFRGGSPDLSDEPDWWLSVEEGGALPHDSFLGSNTAENCDGIAKADKKRQETGGKIIQRGVIRSQRQEQTVPQRLLQHVSVRQSSTRLHQIPANAHLVGFRTVALIAER